MRRLSLLAFLSAFVIWNGAASPAASDERPRKSPVPQRADEHSREAGTDSRSGGQADGAVPAVVTITGNPCQNGGPITIISASYDGGGQIELGTCTSKGAFDCEVPDLSVLGGHYCVRTQDSHDQAEATKCGAQIGMKDFRIEIQAPPRIVEPKDKASMTKESRVSWTGVKNSIYLLRAKPDPSDRNARHYVDAYTSGTHLRWPNLEAMGVRFPVGMKYEWQVSSLRPYASMDELASAREAFAKRGTDFQQATSDRIEVNLVGPVEKPVPPPPSNVRDLPSFPDGIPICGSIEGAKSFAELDDRLAGQQLALRGTLTFGPEWMCTMAGCLSGCCNQCSTYWKVVDSAVPTREVRIHRSLRVNECERPKVPRIDVVATGLLLIDEDGFASTLKDGALVDGFVLDQANLCRIPKQQ